MVADRDRADGFIEDRIERLEMLYEMMHGMINSLQRRVAEQDDVYNRLNHIEKDLQAALGKTSNDWPREPTAIEKRITALQNDIGIAVRSAPRRTIKGGWVNVYQGMLGFAAFGNTTFETKGEADFKGGPNRIACIQIPDITEGEGL